MTQRRKAQAINEYALVAGLVLLVCLGMLAQFGGNIAVLFYGVNEQTSAGGNGGLNGLVGLVRQPPASSGGTNAISGGSSATDGFGTFSAMPGVNTTSREGVIEAIRNVGIGKTTRHLALNLENLLARDDVTPEQASALRGLANQGHRLGMMQEILETTAAQAEYDAADFYDRTIRFEGKDYSVSEFVWLMEGGMFLEHKVTPDKLSTLDTRNRKLWGVELINFVETYKEMKAAGLLSDPGMKQAVVYLAYQIIYLSDSVATNVNNNWVNVEDLKLKAAANMTHSKAESICDTGGGTDGGRQCS